MRTPYDKHVISALGAYCYYHLDASIIIDPGSSAIDECLRLDKRNKQEMQTMSRGLSDFFGDAITA
jgi:hypothetical protein